MGLRSHHQKCRLRHFAEGEVQLVNRQYSHLHPLNKTDRIVLEVVCLVNPTSNIGIFWWK